MADAKTKPRWWWWKNVILPLVGTGGLGAILIAIFSHAGGSPNSGVQNNNSSPTFNTIGNSNTVYNSMTTLVASPSDEERLRSEMKERIRSIFEDVNPEILRAIDSGVRSTNIYISELKWMRFVKLLEYPEFTNYVDLVSHSQVQFGGNNNSFGAGIYDSVRSGGIWRLRVSFKSALIDFCKI